MELYVFYVVLFIILYDSIQILTLLIEGHTGFDPWNLLAVTTVKGVLLRKEQDIKGW